MLLDISREKKDPRSTPDIDGPVVLAHRRGALLVAGIQVDVAGLAHPDDVVPAITNMP